MWNPDYAKKKNFPKMSYRLSKEILGVFGLTLLIAGGCFWTLNELANVMIFKYIEAELLVISEYQLIDLQYAILGISFVSSIVLFIVLFLFLTGERLAYIHEIVKGIHALGRHEWDYRIPLRGENELTELAKQVNVLSKEEQAFQEREKQLQEEKITLIRSLSHDIRTPLTSLMSYSEYMKQKETMTLEEMKAYMELVEQKSQQIKRLTDQLLDGGSRQLEFIENGYFFMEQLADEWASELEEEFDLRIDLEKCPQFSGEFDIQEVRRIFDNLASNIRKYADETQPVFFMVNEQNGRICIQQSNTCKKLHAPVESTKIGIASIQKIAAHYGGGVEVTKADDIFSIQIELIESPKKSLFGKDNFG